jgi:hypothetical protein
MFAEKLLHRVSLMPTRPIDIKPDGIALQPSIEVPKHLEESLPITFACLNHAVPTQQWGHPSRNVEPQPMLTRGGNAQALPPFNPTPTQSRVQAKARLVLEDYGFPLSQRLKFFLKPYGISGPPRLSLADKCNWRASANKVSGTLLIRGVSSACARPRGIDGKNGLL